uniref:Uncharacterized protein n=1 Tax=Romanomermis culicivorax TaxID=13658 RepID=A0A915JTQ7_ROMCU
MTKKSRAHHKRGKNQSTGPEPGHFPRALVGIVTPTSTLASGGIAPAPYGKPSDILFYVYSSPALEPEKRKRNDYLDPFSKLLHFGSFVAESRLKNLNLSKAAYLAFCASRRVHRGD